MQTIGWLAAGISNALTRTTIHFYPSAGNVTAPYPAVCRLAVFGDGLPRQSVTIEGVRLSQPDGIRVEDAFPVLKDGTSSLYGLAVDIAINQPRIDLGESLCVVELSSRIQSARFWPSRMLEPAPDAKPELRPALAIKDGFATTSLVIVNAGELQYEPRVSFRIAHEGAGTETSALALPAVAPDTTQEFDLEAVGGPSFYGDAGVQEVSWGLVRARTLLVEITPAVHMAYYMLYRDAVTRRPVSVSAL